jgi:hypothetical protein
VRYLEFARAGMLMIHLRFSLDTVHVARAFRAQQLVTNGKTGT